MASQTMPNIPLVDFTKESLKPGSSSWVKACNEVRCALEEYGCFMAKYNKVSSEMDKEVFGAVKELFDLPTETKALNKLHKLPYSGYVGQMPRIPIHESMGIEDATTVEGVQAFTNLLWPSGNNKFCDRMLSYSKTVAELGETIDKMVFESYGVDKYYESHIASATYVFRALKYRAPQMNESNIGADVHTDKSFFTILHQNEVSGLKIQARNGNWIDVHFPPESYVVMAGDAYLAWSNNRIHSVRHQVVLNGNKPRYTLALFGYSTEIVKVPEELVDDKHPLQFKPFDNFGLLQFYFKGTTHPSECTAQAYCGISV